MKFKLQVMASFSAKLRAQLLATTERCAPTVVSRWVHASELLWP